MMLRSVQVSIHSIALIGSANNEGTREERKCRTLCFLRLRRQCGQI